jgi:pyruvate dehydrogenase E1 component
MTLTATHPTGTTDEVLRAIEQRVLWLATAIVDHANHVRPNPSGLKVGGHQASSASMVTIMTSLWLEQLRSEDRVSVKPHASPVLHALEYLLGQLDVSYLTTLREFGGLQSYPSRLKDPVPADYSTGSVGIGATAPIWGAIARRYVNTRLGAGGTGRQWSLVGDAELDEGAVWGRCSTRWSPSSARWSGSSTSTGSRSTAWSRRWAPPGCRACSPPRDGRCSP